MKEIVPTISPVNDVPEIFQKILKRSHVWIIFNGTDIFIASFFNQLRLALRVFCSDDSYEKREVIILTVSVGKAFIL